MKIPLSYKSPSHAGGFAVAKREIRVAPEYTIEAHCIDIGKTKGKIWYCREYIDTHGEGNAQSCDKN